MEILNINTVVVSNYLELKEVLEEDNLYNYIYFNNNIVNSGKILINENKKNITIDGTYLGVRYTYTDMTNIDSTETITANALNNYIVVKNVTIVNICRYGIIYVPRDINYINVVTEYNNVKFNGIEMIFNPYGTAKIIDCNVTIENTGGISCQEVCEANIVYIGGTTTINSSSSNFSLFYWLSDVPNPKLIFMANSKVDLVATRADLVEGTNLVDLEIWHDAVVTLTSANGFGFYSNQGANNVLIDKRAIFNMTETSHSRVPMWSVYGDFIMNEEASLNLMNAYSNAPIDNYSIYFKGTNQKFILNNPKSITIYNKMASVFYADNLVEFSFNVSGINMWVDAYSLDIAGSINNIPDYSWYKDDELVSINGTFSSSDLVIKSHNFTDDELSKLPSLDNFTLTTKKQLSVGTSLVNVHPILVGDTSISGHTNTQADVMVRYNGNSQIVSTDENGLFDVSLDSAVSDTNNLKIIVNVNGSFIYKYRTINIPYNGEVLVMDTPKIINFSLKTISGFSNLFPKTEDMVIRVVDSRNSSSGFNLYARLDDELKSSNGFILKEAVVFRKFDGSIVTLSTDNDTLVFSDTSSGNISVSDITFSKEKGVLLDLSNKVMEANEEYSAYIIWKVI